MITKHNLSSGPVDETGWPEQDDPWEKTSYEEVTRDRRKVEAHLRYISEREAAFRGTWT